MSSADLGSYGIVLAFLAAMVGVMMAVAYARLRTDNFVRIGRWALGVCAAFLTVSLGTMTAAMLNNDFSIKYVLENSERALPVGYKIAAVWAGREGSLLLWVWMMAVMAWLASWALRKKSPAQQAAVIGILCVVCAAFAGLMFIGPSPFAHTELPPGRTVAEIIDGMGLNPLLQHPAMIAHPPFLFAGYAACAIPFALFFGAVIARRADNDWVFGVRRWMLLAWAMLTVGIFLGSWWAYVVLGWGGYWGWDAVENASLLPWLAATGVLHSLILQQRRGMFRISNLALVVVTFLMCLVAAFITRSGLISSPHAFARSGTGWFFLGVIVAACAGAGVIIGLRWNLLRSGPPLTRMVSLQGGFIAGNALLGIMTATVLIGTMWSLISGLFLPRAVTLDAHFYNGIVIPMALVLAALMAMGPLLASVTAKGLPMRRLISGGVGAVLGLVLSLVWLLPNLSARTLEADWEVVVAAVIVGFAAFTILDDIIRTLGRPIFNGQEGAAGVWRAFRANSRRFAGMLVHAGMAMVVIGVAGSSLAEDGTDLSLKIGQTGKAGPYAVTLESFEQVKHSHYSALEARAHVKTPGGKTFTVQPERRFYDKDPRRPMSSIALRSGLGTDLYVLLANYSTDGSVAVLKVLIYPLVSWIWIGSIVMAVAGTLCIFHRRPKRIEIMASGAGQDSRAQDAAEHRQVPPPVR